MLRSELRSTCKFVEKLFHALQKTHPHEGEKASVK